MNLDLKRPAQDFTYCDLPKRYEKTKAFILEYALWLWPVLGESIQPVLDIGDSNLFGKRLAEDLEYKYYFTQGDLDTMNWIPNYSFMGKRDENPIPFKCNTAFCFEVLEHLKNPDLFLLTLKAYLHPNAIVIISFPRHFYSYFWSRTHFHEYDKKRTALLFNEAGYEIIVSKWHFIWPDFRVFFKGKKIGRIWIPGIRPMLRLFSGWWLLCLPRQHFYMLKNK